MIPSHANIECGIFFITGLMYADAVTGSLLSPNISLWLQAMGSQLEDCLPVWSVARHNAPSMRSCNMLCLSSLGSTTRSSYALVSPIHESKLQSTEKKTGAEELQGILSSPTSTRRGHCHVPLFGKGSL